MRAVRRGGTRAPPRASLRALLLALLAAAPAGAWPYALDDIHVDHDGRRYRLAMSVRLDATASQAFNAMTRYDALPRVNRSILAARVIGTGGDGSVRLYTDVHVCVTVICRRLQQVQEMRTRNLGGEYLLQASVLPEMSNLHYGTAAWHFRPCGRGSCIDVNVELEPKFWIPPLIGPWLIERAMREQAIESCEGIERLAAEAAATR